MNNLPPCPECKSPYAYESGVLLMCPECGYEWDPKDSEIKAPVVKDANGNLLEEGDTVVTIKDLKVKNAPKPIRAGTKIKNIRLIDAPDHNIDCKVPGFGAMMVTAAFVKKVNE